MASTSTSTSQISTISQALTLNIATMQSAISNIDIICSQSHHEVSLDPINISFDDFVKIFYPFNETFEINRRLLQQEEGLVQYTSFLPLYRTQGNVPFVLLNSILNNAEADLNVPRSAFRSQSLIQLTKELSSLKGLYDINNTNVINSLPFTTLQQTVLDYYVANVGYRFSNSTTSTTSTASTTSTTGTYVPVPVNFVVSVVFHYPTSGCSRSLTLKPTTLNLTYAMDFEIPTKLLNTSTAPFSYLTS